MTQHDPDEAPDTWRQRPLTREMRQELMREALACKERVGQYAAVVAAACEGVAMEVVKLAEIADAFEGVGNDAKQ
jgi:hypothetical protein